MKHYKHIVVFITTLVVLSTTVCFGSEPIIIPTRSNLVVHATSPNVLIMLGNFADRQLNCTMDQVDTKWDRVISLYEEITWGEIDIPTTIVGPWDIAYISTTSPCGLSAQMNQMDEQALIHGVDINQYGHLVYVLPYGTGCGMDMGTLGGNPSRAWIYNCPNSDTFAHEFGHNLGMHHASTPTNEYGDGSDIMGYCLSYLMQVNAGHRDQMYWSNNVRTITQSGTYTIGPLENYGEFLMVDKPDTGDTYYVSYKQPIGYDANIASKYFTVAVHKYKRWRATQTMILALLGNGQSFTDSVNGINITAGDRNETQASVTVTISSGVPSSPQNLRIE